MSEQMLEKLNEVERAGVEHLRQAQVLGVSLAEYCRSFDLDLGKWYRVKQVLTRKGIVVTGTSVAVAGEKPPEFARVKIVPQRPLHVGSCTPRDGSLSAGVSRRPTGWRRC
jgi:hypothetical protein